MLKSLFSGVSGLRNHQMKIDVLGNNIANVNTIGFKGGRIMFSEALNQSIKSANSGVNPMQVGLGMNTSSIENIWSQGGLETTGVATDLAIEGRGFFVVKNGDARMFTRAGNFFFNSNGKLVNHKGFAVQGWTLDPNSTQQTFGGLGLGNTGDITIDTSYTAPAVSTENVWLSGNINAGNRTVAEVWQSPESFINKAIVTGSGAPPAFPLTINAGVNDQFTVTIQDNATSQIQADLTLTAGAYADMDALVAELNSQIAATSNISTRLEAVNNGGTLEFHQANGNVNTSITMTEGNGGLAALGFNTGDTATAAQADATTELNNLLNVTNGLQGLVAGDTIEISGTNPDGSIVTSVFTYGTGVGQDGTTLGDLATVLESSYSGVTVSIDSGNLVVTDNVAGESSTTINLTNSTTNTGTVTFPGFTNTVPGHTGTATTSVIVYDSLGGSHNLVVEFTNTGNANEWIWAASTTSGATIASGGSGRVTFDDSGHMTAFSYNGGVSQLTLNPGNGAEQLNLLLHGEGSEEFSGLTQFDAVSTLSVRDQDGRATGTLTGISIDRDGLITGSFSNGEVTAMAKVALAQFANELGLSDAGDGLYGASATSGDPQILKPEDDFSSSVVSGALEMSNVDLAKEFTEMITAQRGFQANAKVITTADTILDELIRLKR